MKQSRAGKIFATLVLAGLGTGMGIGAWSSVSETLDKEDAPPAAVQQDSPELVACALALGDAVLDPDIFYRECERYAR